MNKKKTRLYQTGNFSAAKSHAKICFIFNIQMNNKKHTKKTNNKSMLITPDEKCKLFGMNKLITYATMTNFKRNLTHAYSCIQLSECINASR